MQHNPLAVWLHRARAGTRGEGRATDKPVFVRGTARISAVVQNLEQPRGGEMRGDQGIYSAVRIGSR